MHVPIFISLKTLECCLLNWPLLVATFFSTLTGLMHSWDGEMKSSRSVSWSIPLKAILKYVTYKFNSFCAWLVWQTSKNFLNSSSEKILKNIKQNQNKNNLYNCHRRLKLRLKAAFSAVLSLIMAKWRHKPQNINAVDTKFIPRNQLIQQVDYFSPF